MSTAVRLAAVFLLLLGFIPAKDAAAQPAPAARLADWDAQQADALIGALRVQLGRYGSLGAQRNMVIAVSEALQRFPYAAQRNDWLWEQAHALWASGAPRACDQYAALFQQSLREQNVLPDGIGEWWAGRETRMLLASTPLDAESGYRDAYLITINGWNLHSLYLLLRWHGGGSYDVTPLCSGRAIAPGRSALSQVQLADLNGDGYAELLVGDYSSAASRFDLVAYDARYGGPSFVRVPAISGLYNARWQILPASPDLRQASLQVSGSQYVQGGCSPVTVERFVWRGGQMQLVESRTDLAALNQRPACARDLFNDLLKRISAGSLGGLETARALIRDWPLECEPGQAVHPLSLTGCAADVRDEARYRLALSLAQAGRVDLARQELRVIVEQPSTPDSRWSEASVNFARWFDAPQALDSACLAAGSCYPALDLRTLLRQTSTRYRAHLFDSLQTFGVPLQAMGLADVDQNGLEEHWFSVQQPLWQCADCPPELWLVVQSNRRFYAQSLGVERVAQRVAQRASQAAQGGTQAAQGDTQAAQGDTQAAARFVPLPPIDGLPMFDMPGQFDQPRVLVRDPASGMVQIEALCDVFPARLDDAQARLLRGDAPRAINASLQAWSEADLSMCPADVRYRELPRLMYLLALSLEWMGDAPGAAAVYAKLALDPGGDLLADMAQAKLAAPVPPNLP